MASGRNRRTAPPLRRGEKIWNVIRPIPRIAMVACPDGIYRAPSRVLSPKVVTVTATRQHEIGQRENYCHAAISGPATTTTIDAGAP